ncbi:MAG: nucleotidyltransferase domain-containing protein [Nitrospirae bacterium]|nr:nucleotidyltransferase domain-containing protein [Nitrospirota bacterium]
MLEKELKVIETFKNLVSQKVNILEFRVFGSRARGSATEESDLDVFIVVDRLDHSIEKYISDCAWEAGFTEDIIIMPVAISMDTLRNSPLRESVFIKNVYREGIAV